MKIKCPIKDCGMEVTERELLKHLLSYSTEKDKIKYIKNYVKLLFKIHDNIKRIETGLNKIVMEDIGRDGFLSGKTQKRIGQVEILKSLLENEK